MRIPLAVLICPSTGFADRVQNKSETPPEEDKVGACGDYFVPEGVNIAINAELPASTQFTAGNHLWGALRQSPNTNKFVQFTDGLSNTILIGECAGREDVWRGRTVKLAKADKSNLATCARARGGAWATNDNPYEIGQRTEWCKDQQLQ